MLAIKMRFMIPAAREPLKKNRMRIGLIFIGPIKIPMSLLIISNVLF